VRQRIIFSSKNTTAKSVLNYTGLASLLALACLANKVVLVVIFLIRLVELVLLFYQINKNQVFSRL
jgi:hypothetical protein